MKSQEMAAGEVKPCSEVLQRKPLQNIGPILEEIGTAFEEQFNAAPKGSDCRREQIVNFMLAHGFTKESEGTAAEHHFARLAYRNRGWKC